MNIPRRPNRRQMDFHQSMETEVRYEGKHHTDAVRTMCMDAVIRTLEVPDFHAVIFTTQPDECETIKKVLCSMARWTARCKVSKDYSDIRFASGGTICVRCIQNEEHDLWKLAGAEWQWMYFFEPQTFTENQIAYLKTRARNICKIPCSVRYIDIMQN